MVLRQTFGKLLSVLGRYYQPNVVKRSVEVQNSVDRETATVVLYGYDSCPYCFRVNREVERLALNIISKDIKRCESFRYELLSQSGKAQVPCLRVPQKDGRDQWFFEPDAIINWFQQRFDPECDRRKQPQRYDC